MFTLSKLKIYSRYEGDGDQWLRTALPWEKREITISEWLLLEDLDNASGKSVLENRTFKKLCDNDKTVAYLKKLLATK
ncbi:hypothetical protein [Sinomicrobium sp. M5D2P9]